MGESRWWQSAQGGKTEIQSASAMCTDGRAEGKGLWGRAESQSPLSPSGTQSSSTSAGGRGPISVENGAATDGGVEQDDCWGPNF